jgi:hypothetical protein
MKELAPWSYALIVHETRAKGRLFLLLLRGYFFAIFSCLGVIPVTFKVNVSHH